MFKEDIYKLGYKHGIIVGVVLTILSSMIICGVVILLNTL